MSQKTLVLTPLARVLGAAGTVIAIVALSACGSEQPPTVGPVAGAPQTIASGSASAGLSTEVNNDVDVIDARIPLPSADSTTAQIEMTMASTNVTGPDTLRAATSPAARAVVFTSNNQVIKSINVPVANGRSVSTGAPNPDRMLLTGLGHPLRAGQSVTVSLVFARAGDATLHIPVVPAVP